MDMAVKQERWQIAHVERRRIRLKEDPKFRDEHKKASRDFYRSKNGIDPESNDYRNCIKNLDNIEYFGTYRLINGTDYLTFTVEEMAKVLGDYNTQILQYRWIPNSMFPAPILVTDDGLNVYLDDEVTTLLPVFSKHQENSMYFRKDHKDTILDLFIAIRDIRRELEL
jgi:hypothetical protein